MQNITITEKATNAIKKYLDKNKQFSYLRIGVRGSGCSGYSTVFKYEEAKKETDITFVFDDTITVIVDPKSLTILDGAKLDYHNSLIKSEFRLDIPNSKFCGCGHSFSTK